MCVCVFGCVCVCVRGCVCVCVCVSLSVPKVCDVTADAGSCCNWDSRSTPTRKENALGLAHIASPYAPPH